MLAIFMGQCAPNAAFLSVASLNEPVDAPGASGIVDTSEVLDHVPDPYPDIETALIQKQTERALCAEVQNFIAGLSPHLRCVALRLYWEEQSQAEIALALGVSRSAICHAARRIEKLIRRDLAHLAVGLGR